MPNWREKKKTLCLRLCLYDLWTSWLQCVAIKTAVVFFEILTSASFDANYTWIIPDSIIRWLIQWLIWINNCKNGALGIFLTNATAVFIATHCNQSDNILHSFHKFWVPYGVQYMHLTDHRYRTFHMVSYTCNTALYNILEFNPQHYFWNTYYHWSTFLQLTTFLQFHLASSILPQSSSFFVILCWDVVFTTMNFSRFLITWRNWNVMIYTTNRCCLILKAFSTVQCSIFSHNYIQPTALHGLCAISESKERSERSCRCSSIFEEGGPKPPQFQSPLAKRVLF